MILRVNSLRPRVAQASSIAKKANPLLTPLPHAIYQLASRLLNHHYRLLKKIQIPGARKSMSEAYSQYVAASRLSGTKYMGLY